jgi:hypothetical protein
LVAAVPCQGYRILSDFVEVRRARLSLAAKHGALGFNKRMSERPQPATKPRRFRFGLRTLLAIVAVAAIASWACWVGRPLWLAHREQTGFEMIVKQLKAGIVTNKAVSMLGQGMASFGWDRGFAFIDDERHSGLMEFSWPNTTYAIYFEYRDKWDISTLSENPWANLEVFRLPNRPIDYTPHTASGRKVIANLPLNSPERPEWAYRQDLLEFLSGDRKNNPGFEYELIYSDPPVKPEGK